MIERYFSLVENLCALAMKLFQYRIYSQSTIQKCNNFEDDFKFVITLMMYWDESRPFKLDTNKCREYNII